MMGTFIPIVASLLLLPDGINHRDDHLEEAIACYEEAQGAEERDLRLAGFRRAVGLFSRVLEEGPPNAALEVNLGNSALQAELLGPAVLAYRRALRLDPDHPKARENLAYARRLLPEWVPQPAEGSILDTFFFWHRSLSGAERAILGALLFTLFAGLLAVAIRWRRAWARNLAVLPGLIWIALMVSLAYDRFEDPGREDAVVIAPEVTARAADSPQAPSRFPEPLPGGTEVRVVEKRESWARIRLANGREAWVQWGGLELVH